MSRKLDEFGVAIAGCGTVGTGVATILTRDAEILSGRIVPKLNLRHIVDIDFTSAKQAGIDEKLFTQNFDDVLADNKVHVIVELIGGTGVAKNFIEKAIRAGKYVVTANKALMAQYGNELLSLARKNNVCIAFEASCAGGIPIIRALYDALIANRIDAIYGILNGTCNYILTAMTQKGQSYTEALSEAQLEGLAEADPSLDVQGTDSAHKLAILASLAFGKQIDFKTIHVEGIDRLDLLDIGYGQELGYVVKLLAIAQRHKDGVCLRVRPVFISKEHPLAWVSGPFNAISVYGHATGHTMYYGRGAGSMPTASAVVADLAAVATGIIQNSFKNLTIWPDLNEKAVQMPIESVRSRYYIRLICDDQPGVFAKIATILGRYGISISSVLQHEIHIGAKGVPVVITTHKSVEGNIRKALVELDNTDVVKTKSVCIGIVDEHPEQL